MHIDWELFTPETALTGGAILGVAVAILLLLNGEIAGISGIVAGLLRRNNAPADIQWRLAFIAGLIAAPVIYSAIYFRPSINLTNNLWLLTSAGLLTGVGTGLASGCTSGHGVCGLARLSPRSLFATLSFMATGFITVFIVRHLLASTSL
ncbi:MAG: YeeE/YedE [Verrucomicrobiaceae bacterium]|nr:YeeE/YedE [Verrucomicrobiaceae bacterium]